MPRSIIMMQQLSGRLGSCMAGVLIVSAIWLSVADRVVGQSGAGKPTRTDQQLAPVAIALQWYPQAQFAGYMMALEKGYYAEAGLAVDLQWYTGSQRDPIQRLSDGQVQFASAWLSSALAHVDQGRAVVNVGQLLRHSALMLIAHKQSGISTPHELDGRSVGLWGGDFDVQPRAFFKKFGARPELVRTHYSIVPFLRGAVDVTAAMSYNEYYAIQEAGISVDQLQVFRFSDPAYDMDFPEDGLYVTADYRRGQPEMIRRFVTATLRGWVYALDPAHEAETLDVVMRYCRRQRTNRNHQRWMLRAMRPLVGYDRQRRRMGQLDQSAFEKVVKILVDQKLLAGPVAYGSFYQPVPGTLGSGRTSH